MLQECTEDLPVFLGEAARIHRQVLAGFEVVQLARLFESEIDLRGIERLKDEHVVPLLAEVRERLHDRRLVAEQVGNHNDERAPPDPLTPRR